MSCSTKCASNSLNEKEEIVKTGAIFEPASTPAPGIVDIGDRKQHFLDDLLVGEIGSYDAGYMMPSGPILHDGQIWIYYPSSSSRSNK